jgi:AcrR family transcriptional regulator
VGCKEGLVRAYLEARHDTRRELITAEINRHDDPRERLLAIFDVLGTTVARPGFRGCAFANAAAESEPESAATEVTREVRRWFA